MDVVSGGTRKQSRNLALIPQPSVLREPESRGRTSAADTEVVGAFSKFLLDSLSMAARPESVL